METRANEMPDIVGDASRRKAGWKDMTGRWVRKMGRKRSKNGERARAENACFVVAK